MVIVMLEGTPPPIRELMRSNLTLVYDKEVDRYVVYKDRRTGIIGGEISPKNLNQFIQTFREETSGGNL